MSALREEISRRLTMTGLCTVDDVLEPVIEAVQEVRQAGRGVQASADQLGVHLADHDEHIVEVTIYAVCNTLLSILRDEDDEG